MVSILKSIKPYWLYLILTGKKKMEASKNYPVREDWDKTCYFYCTKDMKSFKRIPEADRKWMSNFLGKVAIKTYVRDIYVLVSYPEQFAGHPLIYIHSLKSTCLTQEEALEYSNGKPVFAWPIGVDEDAFFSNDFDLFAKAHGVKMIPQSWCYIKV